MQPDIQTSVADRVDRVDTINTVDTIDLHNSISSENSQENEYCSVPSYTHGAGATDIKNVTFYKTVSIFSVCYQLLCVCAIGLFTFCLLHYYISIQYEEQSSVARSDPSNLLLTEIIMLVCQFCVSYNTLIIKLDRVHKKYPEEVFAGIMTFNNRIYGMFSTITFCILQITTMALAPMFVPFRKKNCHQYSHGTCTFVQFIAFFGIAMIIFYGLLVVITVVTALCKGTKGG